VTLKVTNSGDRPIQGTKGAIVSVRCETDFVSRNTDFQKLAKDVAEAYLQKGQESQASNEAKVKAAVNTLGENIQLGECSVIEAPVIGGYVHTNFKVGVLVGLDKGTVEQARDIAMHAAAMNPKVKYPEEVNADVIAKEKEIWKAQLEQEKKPANILENIMKGKEKKFREESALSSQMFVKDNSKTVSQYLAGAKIVQYVRMII
jgi:elongation factor Ts